MTLAVLADQSRLVSIGVFGGIVCFIPPALRLARVVELPGPLVVIIVASIFFHAFGLITDSYNRLANYDTLTHTLSSMTVGVLVFYAMLVIQHYGGSRINFTGRGLSVFTVMIALAFSVYWEVMEYASDVFTGSVTQYSPYDTLTDLMCDALGTVLASLWVWYYMRGRTAEDVVASFGLSKRLSRAVSGDRSDRSRSDGPARWVTSCGGSPSPSRPCSWACPSASGASSAGRGTSS